jgi:hypothetical protein
VAVVGVVVDEVELAAAGVAVQEAEDSVVEAVQEAEDSVVVPWERHR